MAQPGTLLEDLRGLAAILPPNFRVKAAETADVLAALVARAEGGQELVDAAARGAQDVHDFFYDRIAEHAAANGDPAPIKGQPVGNVPQIPGFAPTGGVSRAELDQFKTDLLGQIKQLLTSQQGSSEEPTAAATEAPAVDAGGGEPAAEPAGGEHEGSELGL